MRKVTSWSVVLLVLAASVAAVSVLSSCGSGAAATAAKASSGGSATTVKTTPTITWLPPAPITNPTPLSATQLNAIASVPGTFVYTPSAGTVLAAGTQTLSVTFTPTDATDFHNATASVTITVDPAATPRVLSSPVIYVSETSQSSSNGIAVSSGLIEAFALDVNSGDLSAIPGSPFSTNSSRLDDMALSPNGAFAYVLAENYPAGGTCCGPTSLLVYALDPASGTPTLKQTLPVGRSAGTIYVHPSGQFIYLSPAYDSSGNIGVGVYSVQSDGTLTFSVLVQGLGAISPDGAFLYTESKGSPVGNWQASSSCGLTNWSVSAFRIDSSTGALSPVAGGTAIFQRENCDIGRLPQTLAPLIDPSGKRLFLTDIVSSSVTVFAIDPSTGALSLLPGTTDHAAGYSEAMDPLGRFLYFGGFTGFSLAGKNASGILPPLPGMPVQVTPVSTSYNSSTMAIDPSGAFLFSTWSYFVDGFGCCTPPDELVEFKIDANTGALTQIPSTPITLVGGVSKIVVAPPR